MPVLQTQRVALKQAVLLHQIKKFLIKAVVRLVCLLTAQNQISRTRLSKGAVRKQAASGLITEAKEKKNKFNPKTKVTNIFYKNKDVQIDHIRCD